MKKWLFLTFIIISQYSNGQQAKPPFTDITHEAGIEHTFKVFEGMFGGGACVFDFDKDGFEDVYITSGMNDDILYHNNGNGTFTNMIEGSGLEVTRKFVTQGVAGADVNRDGLVDLFITTINRRDTKEVIPRAINLLFLNQGNGKFKDVTKEWGLDQMLSFSTGVSFGDFDKDGYRDAYIGDYFNDYTGTLTVMNDATIVNSNATAKGYLLHNKGGKGFENVYEAYGLDFKGFGFGGIFTDFDKDGDLDLFVNHDFGYKRTPDMLLRNDYPEKHFTDVAKELGMDLKINSMATAVGDINNDGWLDYYMSNIRFNRMMVSQGANKSYKDLLKEKGMNYVAISWGTNFADFDQDGDLDLFVANGDLNPNCNPMANFYFEQKNGNFEELGRLYGLGDYGIGRGSVTFDFDNDGDQDLLVINQEPTLAYPTETITRLYRNDYNSGNWLKIALKGTMSDLNGIGSRIELVADGKTFIREIDGGSSSHLSQNSTIAHFGFGDVDQISSIKVYWTSGEVQELKNINVNQLLTITEPPQSTKASSNWLYYALAAVLVSLIFWYFLKKRK